MLEHLFRWALKQGPRVLFAVAVLIVLGGFVQAVDIVTVGQANVRGDRSTAWYYIVRFFESLSYQWVLFLQSIFSSLLSASFPLFGALVIDRLDRSRDK